MERILEVMQAQLAFQERRYEEQQQRHREEKGAQAALGAIFSGATYLGTGNLYSLWQPPSVAYRPIRRAMLSQNQRVGAAFAAGAAGIIAARKLVAANNEMSVLVLGLGKLPLMAADGVDDFWQDIQARRAEAQRRRRAARRKQWLRENTKQAVVYRQQ